MLQGFNSRPLLPGDNGGGGQITNLLEAGLIAIRIEPVKKRDASHYVEDALRCWVTYMHTGHRPEGLPSRACGGVTNYTSLDLDNVAAYERLDARLAEMTNACIEDLAPAEQCAIYHKYLRAVYRFPREGLDTVLARAKANLVPLLRRKGVWLGE